MPNSSTEVADVETVRTVPLDAMLVIDGRGRNVVLGAWKMLAGVGKIEAAATGVGVGAA